MCSFVNALFRNVWLKKTLSIGAGLAGVMPIAALAGGYDTGQRDWDFLFQKKPVAIETSTTFINPGRRLRSITGVAGASIDVNEAEAFSVQRFGLAVNFSDALRCLGSLQEPLAGHANYGTAWTYAISAVEQHFSSQDLGLTCAVSFEAGRGNLSLIGGVSQQEIEYELTQSRGPFGLARTKVSDSAMGWRVGLAYEIPEYALRASLIYNSAFDYDMTGTFTNPAPGGRSGAIYGSITMPQSTEFKFQSGVAPGWLAFGSVKWTDWSVADNMPLCLVTVTTCTQAVASSGLTLLWQDTWTVTVGAAHQFSDRFTLAGNLTWDQGGTQGFTSQTDTFVGGLTAIFDPSSNLQIKLGGTLGLMQGGSLSTMTLANGAGNPVGYTAVFSDDMVYSLNASATFRF